MKNMMLLVVTLFLIVPLYSQNDSTCILPKLKIYQKEKSKIVYYSFEEREHNKFIINDSFLTADSRFYNYAVKINDIDHVSFQSGRDFWGGAKVMGAVGYVLGFLFYGFGGFYGFLDTEPKFRIDYALLGGVIGAVPFGLLGGLIGLLSPAYDDYDFNKIPPGSKNIYLKKIFKKNGFRTF